MAETAVKQAKTGLYRGKTWQIVDSDQRSSQLDSRLAAMPEMNIREK